MTASAIRDLFMQKATETETIVSRYYACIPRDPRISMCFRANPQPPKFDEITEIDFQGA